MNERYRELNLFLFIIKYNILYKNKLMNDKNIKIIIKLIFKN